MKSEQFEVAGDHQLRRTIDRNLKKLVVLRVAAGTDDILDRERFRVMGIDPALAVTLRRGEEAVAELAAIPGTPDQKAADEAIVRPECSNGDDGARRVGAKIARMAAQYRGCQHRLDLVNASALSYWHSASPMRLERGDDVSRSAG